MKIVSEVTGRDDYKTLEECLADEKEFLAKKEAEEKEKNKVKNATRKKIEKIIAEVEEVGAQYNAKIAEANELLDKMTSLKKEKSKVLTEYRRILAKEGATKEEEEFVARNSDIIDLLWW